MNNISTPYLIYWTAGCILLGVLLSARVISPMPIADDHLMHFNHDHQMQHGQLEVDP